MIVCAAVKVIDQTKPPPFDRVIISCLRHSNGYSVLQALCPERHLHVGAEEGFIDHTGNFLTREEAYEHALACGQIPAALRELKRQRGETMLFSEDLY